jgi:hypothetical protein
MIDYTSRDFYSLREDLIARIKDRVTTWSGDDPADFGVALVEAFSYMGDVMSYYTDRVANESRLTTATQRNNVISLARSYGYSPSGYQSATATFYITNSSADAVEIPANTQFYAIYQDGKVSKKVQFYTAVTITVPAKASGVNGNVLVGAKHGEVISLRYTNDSLADDTTDIPGLETAGNVAGELLGVSSGLPNQSFTLSENQVVQGTVEVWVENGGGSSIYGLWEEVDSLIDYNPGDTVFSTSIDADNFVTVTFGDGVSGLTPPKDADIKVKYIVGGGTDGNIDANTVFVVEKIPGQPLSLVNTWNNILSVSVQEVNGLGGSGGENPESDAAIRNGALETLRVQNRAVTTEDYRRLALGIPGVGKSNAEAAVWSSVNLYVAPSTGVGYPLYGSTNSNVTNSDWDTLKSRVEGFVSGKELIGTTVTVKPPVYKDVILSIEYVKFEQYLDYQVRSAMQSILNSYFSYEKSVFGQVIYPEDVEFVLRSTPGVATARVTEMYLSGGSAGTRTYLVGGAGDIFIFTLDNVASTKYRNESHLFTQTGTMTGVSPTFTPDTLAYEMTTVATSSKTLVFTHSTNASLVVTKVNAGVSSTVAATSSTAGGGVTASTYTFDVGTSAVTVKVSSRGGLSSTTYLFT